MTPSANERNTSLPDCIPDEMLFMLPRAESAEVRSTAAQEELAWLREVIAGFGGYVDEDGDVVTQHADGEPGVTVLPARGLNAEKREEAYELFEQVDRLLRDRGSRATWQPNWLTGAVSEGGGKGSAAGPGARPLPLDARYAQKSLPLRRSLLSALHHAAQEDATVRLIFLDAWNQDQKETARLATQFPLYRYLNDRCRGEQFDMRNYFASRDPDPFPMPDHGLFASYLAGTVIGEDRLALHDSILARLSDEERKSLPREGMPPEGGHVIIESFRVLDDYGAGDCLRLIEAFRRIAESMHSNERVIVNLSLVVNTPLLSRVTRRAEAYFDGRWPGQDRRSDSLDCVLYDAVRTLYEKGALLVAATGNDSEGEMWRDPSRLPATYEEVLDVTAASPGGETEAWYANRATAHGIALFAGDLVPKPVHKGKGKGHKKSLDEQVDILDERYLLFGPFTDSYVPIAGTNKDPQNQSGVVAWAGTSFAAPLASGLAALLWLANADSQAHEVRSGLVGLAKGRTLQSGTPFIDLFEFDH